MKTRLIGKREETLQQIAPLKYLLLCALKLQAELPWLGKYTRLTNKLSLERIDEC